MLGRAAEGLVLAVLGVVRLDNILFVLPWSTSLVFLAHPDARVDKDDKENDEKEDAAEPEQVGHKRVGRHRAFALIPGEKWRFNVQPTGGRRPARNARRQGTSALDPYYKGRSGRPGRARSARFARCAAHTESDQSCTARLARNGGRLEHGLLGPVRLVLKASEML